MLCVTILMSILAFCAADMDVFEGPQLARLSSQNFPANATHVVINVRSQQSPLGQGRGQLYGDLDLPERTVKRYAASAKQSRQSSNLNSVLR